MHRAAVSGDLLLLGTLVEHGGGLDDRDDDQNTPAPRMLNTRRVSFYCYDRQKIQINTPFRAHLAPELTFLPQSTILEQDDPRQGRLLSRVKVS